MTGERTIGSGTDVPRAGGNGRGGTTAAAGTAEGRPEAPGGDLPVLEVGGGAAAGALLGRLLGGGARGAVIGAALGAAAGTALSLGTRRKPRGGRGRGTARSPARAPRREAARRGEPPRGEAPPPPEEPLEEWTKARLYELAQELDIAGRSRMRKAELIRALRRHPDVTATRP